MKLILKCLIRFNESLRIIESTLKLYISFYFQNIFSSGKSFEAIAVATLFDKGLLNYEDTIAKYWPEFAQNGKENVKICDVLRHESGLAYFQGNFLKDINKKTCRSQIKLQPTC